MPSRSLRSEGTRSSSNIEQPVAKKPLSAAERTKRADAAREAKTRLSQLESQHEAERANYLDAATKKFGLKQQGRYNAESDEDTSEQDQLENQLSALAHDEFRIEYVKASTQLKALEASIRKLTSQDAEYVDMYPEKFHLRTRSKVPFYGKFVDSIRNITNAGVDEKLDDMITAWKKQNAKVAELKNKAALSEDALSTPEIDIRATRSTRRGERLAGSDDRRSKSVSQRVDADDYRELNGLSSSRDVVGKTFNSQAEAEAAFFEEGAGSAEDKEIAEMNKKLRDTMASDAELAANRRQPLGALARRQDGSARSRNLNSSTLEQSTERVGALSSREKIDTRPSPEKSVEALRPLYNRIRARQNQLAGITEPNIEGIRAVSNLEELSTEIAGYKQQLSTYNSHQDSPAYKYLSEQINQLEESQEKNYKETVETDLALVESDIDAIQAELKKTVLVPERVTALSARLKNVEGVMSDLWDKTMTENDSKRYAELFNILTTCRELYSKAAMRVESLRGIRSAESFRAEASTAATIEKLITYPAIREVADDIYQTVGKNVESLNQYKQESLMRLFKTEDIGTAYVTAVAELGWLWNDLEDDNLNVDTATYDAMLRRKGDLAQLIEAANRLLDLPKEVNVTLRWKEYKEHGERSTLIPRENTSSTRNTPERSSVRPMPEPAPAWIDDGDDEDEEMDRKTPEMVGSKMGVAPELATEVAKATRSHRDFNLGKMGVSPDLAEDVVQATNAYQRPTSKIPTESSKRSSKANIAARHAQTTQPSPARRSSSSSKPRTSKVA